MDGENCAQGAWYWTSEVDMVFISARRVVDAARTTYRRELFKGSKFVVGKLAENEKAPETIDKNGEIRCGVMAVSHVGSFCGV